MKGGSCRDPEVKTESLEETDTGAGRDAVTLECSASADTEVADGVVEVVHDQVDEGVADTDQDELATTEFVKNDCGFETNIHFQTEPPRCWLRGP